MGILIKEFKAAIFDLDGTLINSMPFWSELDYRFFTKRGMELPPDYAESGLHRSMIETAVYTKERFGFSESPEELVQEWQNMAVDFYANEVKLKDGAYEYLKSLKKNGIKIALATANSESLYRPALRHCKIEEFFDVCVSSDDVGEGKDSPKIYHYASEKLGASIEETVVFEDTYQCVRTAKNAGYYTIGVNDSGFSSDNSEKTAQTADLFISSFNELI